MSKPSLLDALLKEQTRQVRRATGEPIRQHRFDLPTTTLYRCMHCGAEFRTLKACEEHPHARIDSVLVAARSAR